MTQLRVDSQPIGWVHPHGYALWIEAVHKGLPRIIIAAEELAWQRALYAGVLLQRAPADAHHLSQALGVPLDGVSDIDFGVGDAAEIELGRLEEEPPLD